MRDEPNIFDLLDNGSNVVNIREGLVSRYDIKDGEHVIYWNSDAGVYQDRGSLNTQSPALGLIHEAGHVYQLEYDWANTQPLVVDQELPEGPVISGIETRVATFYGEPVRTGVRKHGGIVREGMGVTEFTNDQR
ncbi:hypothetical protein [Wenzhouxiangella marina]|uniref:hypothetical protein n=1 Tax=Wenzhouxiangella marina TaxID=1579979 RepID=UPI0012E10C3B|nr:hypothetical protein [Wenzhouxiangella marina]MBB6086409.1 hypothetical protein [Wenzhouxiangella marina]